MKEIVNHENKFKDVKNVFNEGMREKLFPSFLTDTEVLTLLSFTEGVKQLPNWKWICLFGAYLAKDWKTFKEYCKDWEVGVEYAKYYCHLADKYIPRREGYQKPLKD